MRMNSEGRERRLVDSLGKRSNLDLDSDFKDSGYSKNSIKEYEKSASLLRIYRGYSNDKRLGMTSEEGSRKFSNHYAVFRPKYGIILMLTGPWRPRNKNLPPK